MRTEIEDGFGCAGLVPNAAEREAERTIEILRKELQRRIALEDKAESFVRDELARINSVFGRGKGIAGQPDFVCDDVWHRLLGEQFAFNAILLYLEKPIIK